jgi:hypothetical protein
LTSFASYHINKGIEIVFMVIFMNIQQTKEGDKKYNGNWWWQSWRLRSADGE